MIELLLVLFIQSSQPKIVTCQITGPEAGKAVICPERKRKGKMTGTIYFVSGWSEEKLDEWRWRAPMRDGGVYPDGKLSKADLQIGDGVKAQIINGELFPVADCKVRVWRNMQKWLENRRGERMPFGLWTDPDDCQPWYLLEKAK